MPSALIGLALLALTAAGSPLDHLPPAVEVLTRVGERPDFSPDNRQVAFMGKSFGDAFVIDLETRAVRCLTCHLPGAAFLRVMHLVNGDYLLVGPERFRDPHTSRYQDSELWVLPRAPGSTPVRLGQKVSEGPAVSKIAMRIGYAEWRPGGASRLVIAELSGTTLLNRRTVHESPDGRCTIEAQDFYADDRRMTFTCYEPKGAASVMSVNLTTGRVTNMSNAPGTYNEAEGIFPGGEYTCVEADRQCRTEGCQPGFRSIDIWKLRLDGTGRGFTRLTSFTQYPGWKASNPVVSTDGRFMAFQAAHSADEPGVGRGILIYRLAGE
jgi:hypothetical protein